MKTLYIIDASGFLYRSYFAIRNITNSKGESTNALYGFIRSLLKLRKDFQPEHLVAIFDGPHNAKSREAIFTDYKAHRKATPPDLIYQIEWARQACELMGIPLLSVPEVEADDTMGSVALWAAQKDAKVFLCTSDKDLCQIVDENIHILNTHKDNLILGPKEVEENFGVTPRQIIDYLAITGDASDNVPGLPGFGPKTASALLKQYGTLDYILEHPEVVSGKKQDIIVEHGNQARMSRQLVTIHTNVEFPQDKTFFSIKTLDPKPLKEFYASMNFNSLIRELEQTPAAQTATTPVESEEQVAYTLIDDEAAFSKLLQHLSTQKEICVSAKATADTQPVKAELVGIAFCTAPKQAWYIPAHGRLGITQVLNSLKAIFENEAIGFYGHNIKFDYQVLANYGIKIKNIAFDTMLASYLLNSHSRQHDLDHLMLELLGKVKMPFATLVGKGKNAQALADIPLASITAYAGEEADYICRLKEILERQLSERNLKHLLTDLEIPLLHVLAVMERHGIYLDLPYLEKISKDVTHLLSGLEQEIYLLSGETFNINSPKQLGDICNKLGIPLKKTSTGHFSTSADVLEALKDRYPLAGKILEYRTLEKLRSTYIDSLPLDVYSKTHRVHCTFNQSVAATGRLSCQDPNLQNIPIRTEAGRKIRGAFRPEKEGWSFLAADYSQIELRLLAHFSEDPTLLEAFNKGADIHTHTAAHIFGVPLNEVTKEQRYGAKAVNFGIIYGQQAFGLAQELGIEVKQAAIFIDAYFKRYPKVKDYLESSKAQARQTGKSITYTGRERLIPEINSRNGQLRALAERLAVNTPLQGTAADLIKMAMLQIDEKMRAKNLKGYMILQVHDELIFEVPDTECSEVEALVRETMQEVLSLKVPLVVDIIIGKNWAEC